jgi:hypothetical protein
MSNLGELCELEFHAGSAVLSHLFQSNEARCNS